MNKNIKTSHRERITSLLAGEIVDQLPITFWRHFPLDDQTPDRLAQATINFQNTFDLDLIKISPSSSFCIRDWGIQDEWRGNSEGTRDYLSSLGINEVSNLKIQDPYSGSLGNQLKSISIIADSLLSEVPIVQTIFSPLSQLKNLLGKKNLNQSIRHHPDKVEKALEIITESTRLFMKACMELSIDGFFYAIQHANSDALSLEEFLTFGKRYDERLFGAILENPINILHIHGSDIYFNDLLDYPCQIFNWHDRDTQPNLSEALKRSSKVPCGGLSRIKVMVRGSEYQISNQIADAVDQMRSKNFILGTGCVLPIITPFGNIKHAVKYARSI